MKKKKFIKMTKIDDIKKFVNLAMAIDEDIDVIKGRYCIDARSFLGVLGIDMSTGVIVIYPENAIEFEEFLKAFEE